MAWDDVAGKAAGNNGDKYVVLQVVRGIFLGNLF